jgi:hypothetical protein
LPVPDDPLLIGLDFKRSRSPYSTWRNRARCATSPRR